MGRWVPLASWEGIYEIHPQGLVRRVRAGHGVSNLGKPLGTTLAGAGYHTVRLSDSERRERPYVHTLVLETFRAPRPPGYEGDHRDRDKSNNSIGNLRWVTHKENCKNRDNRAIGFKTWEGKRG